MAVLRAMLKELLTGIGAGCEFTGILLVAAPELFPRAGRAWADVRGGTRRAWGWLLRLIRRRRRGVTVPVGPGGAVAGGGYVSGIASKEPLASLEEKVAFLLDQDRKTQERLNAMDEAARQAAEARRREIAAVQRELEAFVGDERQRERDVHIRVRLVGVCFLLAGVPVLAVANVA
jgi:hypothetical protein